jgi:hypothetical protein
MYLFNLQRFIIIIIIYLSSVDPYIGSQNKPVDIEHVTKY